MSRPLLFLDFDGVLNNRATFEPPRRSLPHGAHMIEPSHVARVQRIVDATGADVVVSSSWRHGTSVEALTALLRSRGARFVCRDKTPEYGEMLASGIVLGSVRGDEIQTWLDDNGGRGAAFPHGGWHAPIAILDDEPEREFRHLSGYLVRTTFEHGLADEHIERAIGMLNQPPPADRPARG